MGTNDNIYISLDCILDMYNNLLTEIGLTKSEIAVYFALLDLGSSTTGPIIKKAGIASGKAYLVLDKLVLKGLVSYSIQANEKHYQAKSPERLVYYLKEKQNILAEKTFELKKILPDLKARYESKKYLPTAEVFEGEKGFKTFYEWVLDELSKGEHIDILGVPREANERFSGFFLEWNKRRIMKGIKMRIIYNSDCRDYGKRREKMKLTEVRYMKKELETPAWIDIFQDYVVTINVHGVPICFLIKNKESADSYRKWFELLWKIAKK